MRQLRRGRSAAAGRYLGFDQKRITTAGVRTASVGGLFRLQGRVPDFQHSQAASAFRRHPKMMRAIGTTPPGLAAAKQDPSWNLAERPAATGVVKLEQWAWLHLEVWHRVIEDGRRLFYRTANRPWPRLHRHHVEMLMHAVGQHALGAQPLRLAAYGRARAVQAPGNLLRRVGRPQGNKFAEFLVGPAHGGPRSWRLPRLVPCLPIPSPFWRLPSFPQRPRWFAVPGRRRTPTT